MIVDELREVLLPVVDVQNLPQQVAIPEVLQERKDRSETGPPLAQTRAGPGGIKTFPSALAFVGFPLYASDQKLRTLSREVTGRLSFR